MDATQKTLTDAYDAVAAADTTLRKYVLDRPAWGPELTSRQRWDALIALLAPVLSALKSEIATRRNG